MTTWNVPGPRSRMVPDDGDQGHADNAGTRVTMATVSPPARRRKPPSMQNLDQGVISDTCIRIRNVYV